MIAIQTDERVYNAKPLIRYSNLCALSFSDESYSRAHGALYSKQAVTESLDVEPLPLQECRALTISPARNLSTETWQQITREVNSRDNSVTIQNHCSPKQRRTSATYTKGSI